MFRYLRSLYLACAILLCITGHAQNLVPNGDFELYNNCPSGLTGAAPSSGIGFSLNYTIFPTVQNWVRPMVLETPDYFNTCAPVGDAAHAPNNLFGYQQPHSGNGYAGFYPFNGMDSSGYPKINNRELITIKLSNPMKKDSTYCVSFYVSPTARASFPCNIVAVNEVGANFSDTMPHNATDYHMTLPYHIMNDTANHLDDTTQWYKVSGSYVAKGGEQWMTIGTFFNSIFPAYSVIPPAIYNPNAGGWSGYFYLDDVSVYEMASFKALHDTVFCDTASMSVQLSSSLPGSVYTWNNGEITQSITVKKPGVYWVAATSNCATYTDTFRLNFTPLPTPVVRDTIICQNGPSPIINVTGNNLVWYTSPNDAIGTSTQPTISTAHTGPVTIYVAAVFRNCSSPRVPVTVAIIAPPPGHPLYETTPCKDELQSITIGQADSGINYTWSTGENLCCIQPGQDGIYIRTAYNRCGAALDTSVIHSVRCNDCLHFPTAFSPNNDGLNDVFRSIVLCPLSSYTLNIFDRWGECIFTTDQVTGKWDGKKNGQLMPLGTYYYMATCTHAVTGEKFMVKGDVALIW